MSSCARCGLVKYCGGDCQRAHWKEHRPLYIPRADRVQQPVESLTSPPSSRESPNQDEEECAICFGPLAGDGSSLTLPWAASFMGRASRAFAREGWPRYAPSAAENYPLAPISCLGKSLSIL